MSTVITTHKIETKPRLNFSNMLSRRNLQVTNESCTRSGEESLDSLTSLESSCCTPYSSQEVFEASPMRRKSSISAGPSVRLLSPQNVEVGRVLGTGGFCTVSEVKSIQFSRRTHHKSEPTARRRRSSILSCTNAPQRSNNGYAIKCLSERTKRSPCLRKIGASDLESEARLLASFNHPNIIKLRGVSTDDAFHCDQKDMGFFLLLDLLDTTLDKRLREWRSYSRQSLTRRKMPLSVNRKRRSFLCQRLRVALDVASALEYLHRHHCIFRDLKPENIGFLPNGDVQLFDFGLAKQLDCCNAFTDEVYKMSGNTGSRRYMAPEVALNQPYNMKADVYSFGLLLWQLMALSVPYYETCETKEEHMLYVVKGDYRPPINPKWPSSLKVLIARCWDANPKERPTMESCAQILRAEIELLEEERDVHNSRKRSSFSFGSPAKVNPARGTGLKQSN